jgi:zinc protease
MSTRRALLAVALFCCMLPAGCSSRPRLPGPSLPLARTPDAEFRARPPAPAAFEARSAPLVHMRKLGNGLSVFVVERSSGSIASVRLVVRRAGREAATDPRGLGSLVARTLLFGTRLSDGRVLSHPTLLGLSPAVVTTEDAVVLALDTHAAAMPDAVAVLASLATRPVFTNSGLSQALSDQLDAIANRSRSPESHLREAALERLYGEAHPLARPVLGISSEVRNISLAQVRTFFAARYRPAATALVIAGDVSANRVFEVAERELGSWTSAAPEPSHEPAPAVIDHAGDRPLVALTSGSALTTLLITIPGPGGGNPDWLPFSLAGTAISGLALSRGNQALSHHDIKSYGVVNRVSEHEASSELFLSFAVEPADIEDSLETMLGLVDSLAQKPLSTAELERVRARYLTALTENYASNAGCVGLIGAHFRAGLPAEDLLSLRTRVAWITAADVQEAARRWLSRHRIQIAAFTDPYEGGRALSSFGRVDWFSLETTVTK